MNLQNIDKGPYRQCFIGDFTVCDYSNQELRVAAAYSKEKTMLKAFNEGVDLHSQTSLDIFGNLEKRQIAKTLNFSILYGSSAFNLVSVFDIPLKEGEDIINKYWKTKPELYKWITKVRNNAKEKGFVEIDKLGRRYYFKDFAEFKQLEEFIEWCRVRNIQVAKKILSRYFTLKGSIERESGNYVIQGTSASITKLALIYLYREGITPIMVVHDEIVIEGKHKEKLEEIMQKAWNYFIKSVQMPLQAVETNYWTH